MPLAQAKFLDTMDLKYADVAILFSAALSLFLELAIIRWQSSVFPFLAFYKNFSLLACFVGLGLGYALAMRERILLAVVLPLLAWQFSFMTIVRYAGHVSLNATPFREELSMGSFAVNLPHILFLYAVLTVIFLLTVCIFLPVGQLCGRIMERRKKLRAYGLNLLGSPSGVVLMLGVSYLWTPTCCMVRAVFPRHSCVHAACARLDDVRGYFRGCLHDCPGVAGEILSGTESILPINCWKSDAATTPG